MAFGAKCALDKITTTIVGFQTNSYDLSQATGSVNSLENVYSVKTLSDLPLAECNIGRLVYVEDIASYRYSDGYYWVIDACSVLGNPSSSSMLWTWGQNTNGRLGDGTTVNRCSPGTVSGGGIDWCNASKNDGPHNTAIKTDGTIWSWGYNNCGQLGDGTTIARCSPGTVAGGGTNWCQVSGGCCHTSAIKTDGTLWTWGETGIMGVLGDGTQIRRCSPGTVAGGGTTWCQVSSGVYHIASIKTDGTLWTWGCNGGDGRLGNGTTVDRCSPGGIGSIWRKISAGYGIFSGIKCDGTIWTWGGNSVGQLGSGTTVFRCSPGTIAGGGTTWCDLDNFEKNGAAIKTDGTLWTWGLGGYGRLGDGTNYVNRCSPGTVAGGGTTWCCVAVGCYALAAIKTDGTLWTWGANFYGGVGDGTTIARCSPGTVAGGGTNWCKISADRYQFLAIKTDGTLWTWGKNYRGVLGDGTTLRRCSPGTVAGGGTTWCGVAPGSYHSMAIKTDGTIWTWGNNGGQLGDGTTIARCSPGTIVNNDTTWCSVDGGTLHSIAIKTDGTLWGWGLDVSGELGGVDRCSPGTVIDGGLWTIPTAGFWISGGIKTDGTLWTWGRNNGQLGDGTTVNRTSPGTVAGDFTNKDWCQVSSANTFSVAIKTDGTLWTWGCNTSGNLGDGTTVNRCSPGTIAGGGTTWRQVSSSFFSSVALKTDGTLWSWGGNGQGQLGSGVQTTRCSPGTIAGGGTTWCQVSMGVVSVASIKTDGTIWTWGSNTNGILGDGTTICRCSPGTVAGGGTTWCKVFKGTIAIKSRGF